MHTGSTAEALTEGDLLKLGSEPRFTRAVTGWFECWITTETLSRPTGQNRDRSVGREVS